MIMFTGGICVTDIWKEHDTEPMKVQLYRVEGKRWYTFEEPIYLIDLEVN